MITLIAKCSIFWQSSLATLEMLAALVGDHCHHLSSQGENLKLTWGLLEKWVLYPPVNRNTHFLVTHTLLSPTRSENFLLTTGQEQGRNSCHLIIMVVMMMVVKALFSTYFHIDRSLTTPSDLLHISLMAQCSLPFYHFYLCLEHGPMSQYCVLNQHVPVLAIYFDGHSDLRPGACFSILVGKCNLLPCRFPLTSHAPRCTTSSTGWRIKFLPSKGASSPSRRKMSCHQ